MNYLTSFSDWTLALAPRLFLYPGGLFLLALLMLSRVASRGVGSVRPRVLFREFANANLPCLALAWSAVALLPVPGAQPLPFPADRFVLAGLLAAAFLLDPLHRTSKDKSHLEVAILTAAVAPLAGQISILGGDQASLPAWLSLGAMSTGVVALIGKSEIQIEDGVRLIGWLTLAAAPLWTLQKLQNGAAPPTLLALVAVIGLCAWGTRRIRAGWLEAATWGLATLALFTALL
ncbi:MAG TPA: hypothetical protein VM409_07590 [Chloroflexia bacterium]|nr:hypothetical protein [Chloroflexia bacterium]